MNSQRFKSPYAALVWKEWRECWWIVLLPIIPICNWWFNDPPPTMAIASPRVLAKLACVGAFLILGARLFASDKASGASHFCDERPVERELVWRASLVLPIIALAVLSVLFYGHLSFLGARIGFADKGFEMFLMAAAMLGAFACGTLCSVLLDRPITALGAGAALGTFLAVGQGTFFEYLYYKSMLLQPPFSVLIHNGFWFVPLVFAAECLVLLWLACSKTIRRRWIANALVALVIGQGLLFAWFAWQRVEYSFSWRFSKEDVLVLASVILAAEPLLLLWLARTLFIRWRRD